MYILLISIMKNVFLILSLLLLFVSCQKEKTVGGTYETIVIDLDQKKVMQKGGH